MLSIFYSLSVNYDKLCLYIPTLATNTYPFLVYLEYCRVAIMARYGNQ
jgi:hypothetical protein